ncbi:MAG: DinB family protein [Rhodoferax sp.]|nr:DinB family protein [Rhodoferax sp.]MCP5264362.1 DinB family protein [Rhodoferax sp.]
MQADPRSPSAHRFKLFWQPGCSSCVRTKEFLQKRGVDFESVNVAANPERLAELRALGARSVPIVSSGDTYTLCQSIQDVASFVGVPMEAREPLAGPVLFDRLQKVLGAAIRFTLQFPVASLRETFRDRNRTLGDTAFHIFRVAEMGLETGQGHPLRPEGFAQKAPADWGGEQIAAYGRDVSARLDRWWACADPAVAHRVETYYGRRTMHEVLERTTWHAAQHARQLVLMLEAHGIAADRPLTPADLAGLPMPDDPWG